MTLLVTSTRPLFCCFSGHLGVLQLEHILDDNIDVSLEARARNRCLSPIVERVDICAARNELFDRLCVPKVAQKQQRCVVISG